MGFRLAVNSPQLVVSKLPEVRPQHRHRQRFSKFKLVAVLEGQFNVMEVHMVARRFRDFLRDASLAVKRRSPLCRMKERPSGRQGYAQPRTGIETNRCRVEATAVVRLAEWRTSK